MKKANGLKNLEFMVRNAVKLPFEDNNFDIAVISFGLRNLTDITVGLKGMERVVKPGGYICNIDQGKPSNPLSGTGINLRFFRLFSTFSGLFHRRVFILVFCCFY